jgi:hypothetical protein
MPKPIETVMVDPAANDEVFVYQWENRAQLFVEYGRCHLVDLRDWAMDEWFDDGLL